MTQPTTLEQPPSRFAAANKLKLQLDNVRFEHTIFALPFAYLGMVLAAGGLPTLWQFWWINVAMVAARTMAMSLNRLIDAEIDRRNPRTAVRPIPSGRLSGRDVGLAALLSFGVLLLAAVMLNPLCVALLPIAVVFLVGYHYTKRFTWLCHYVLGVADGGAALGGWVAVTGELAWPPVWMGVALAAWVAGFDLIYSCQDADFDRRNNLKSVPAVFGIRAALGLSVVTHIVTILALSVVGWQLGLGALYWIGVAVTAALLAYEHLIVRPDDLSRLNVAFFNLNSLVAVVLFVFTAADLFF